MKLSQGELLILVLLKCGPQPAQSASLGKLLDMQISTPHQLLKENLCGWGPAVCVLTCPQMILKHC